MCGSTLNNHDSVVVSALSNNVVSLFLQGKDIVIYLEGYRAIADIIRRKWLEYD